MDGEFIAAMVAALALLPLGGKRAAVLRGAPGAKC